MRDYRCYAIIVVLVLLSSGITAEESLAMPPTFMQSTPLPLNGYARTIAGQAMEYESPLPWLRQALIARASDGKSEIIWETEAMPQTPSGQGVRFLWLAGLGCNLGDKRFHLSIGDRRVLEFSTRDLDDWQEEGAGGERLTFKGMLRDRYNDRFGLMTLEVPAVSLPAGRPLVLKVAGDSANSSAWVMTFTGAVRQEILVHPAAMILRNNGRPLQPVNVEIFYLGSSGAAVLRAAGHTEERRALTFGRNSFQYLYPPAERETPLSLEVEIDGQKFAQSFTLKPVRPWQIFFVQHTHTDIGYTRPQTDILAEHLRYIDYALDYCDQTDHLPDDARFRWTCETSWAVREYLKCRPAAQIARLKRRVLEGRVELGAQLLNWAEVADENALLQSLDAVKTFRAMGFPVQTALQNDVNGYAWCFADYFHDLGIKYVTSGINAHRALKPFDLPTAFWWESPSGKRILAFRADHYMTGNMIGLTGGGLESLEKGLSHYLEKLAAAGYPLDQVSLQYSGYFTDNAPPSTIASEVIRQWNETYLWPRLRNATAHEFLAEVAERRGKELPVLRVAWPDWWTDGYGCAMRETAAGRTAQAGMLVNQGLLSMARLLGAELPETVLRQSAAVMDNLNFYNEHTFGAAESISDPLAENTQIQWSEKASYLWQAVMESRLLREAAMGQLQSYLSPADVPVITLFNTLNWSRSALHTLFIDNQILPKEKDFRLVDEGGCEAAVQLLNSRAEGNTWAIWAEDVPPMGSKSYRILSGSEPLPLPAKYMLPEGGVIENRFYRAVLDRQSGAISSLVDRELGVELLDPQRQWQLGQFIYERLLDRRPMEELRLGEHRRTSLQAVTVEPGIDGPIWQSLIITGRSEGFTGMAPVRCELRFYRQTKRIELLFLARKEAVTAPEAVYVAFPFALAGGGLVFEAQGGLVRPGENQLERTANDWNTVQNFSAVRGRAGQVVLVSDEVPLVQFGAINTGRYQANARPASQQIFSWVLNNYWTTNFRASQEGEMSWSYQLTSSGDGSDEIASRFGWGQRVPLVSRVLPAAGAAMATPAGEGAVKSPGANAGAAKAPAASAAGTAAGQDANQPAAAGLRLWPFKAAPVVLVASRPLAQGILLHLREVAGGAAVLQWAQKSGLKMAVCDPFGEGGTRVDEVRFQPGEVKFVRLWQ